MNIGVLLKIVSHLGQLSSVLKDFEAAAKDLFDGKLTKEEIEKLLSDVISILSIGFVQLPEGVAIADVESFLHSSESVVSDVLKAVSDVEAGGVATIPPNAKQLASDLLAALESGLIKDFGGHTKEQVIEVLKAISGGL